jgi:hypothetical protein
MGVKAEDLKYLDFSQIIWKDHTHELYSGDFIWWERNAPLARFKIKVS